MSGAGSNIGSRDGSISESDGGSRPESDGGSHAGSDGGSHAARRAEAAPLTYVGPFDREPWPEQLTATVVSPGEAPRLAGYDVADDLARHYGIAEVAWLALRGELPSDAERAAFETALVLLAPVHIGQAPAHAAFLSRLLAAEPSATLAVAAVGLGELGRVERAELVADRAIDPTTDPAIDPAAAAADATAALAARPRVARAYALLHQLGFREPLALELLATWARLPATIAEALAARPGAVRTYPARLPDYRYVDEEGTSP